MGGYAIFVDRKTRLSKDNSFYQPIYKLNEIPVRISAGYFVDMDKVN